jgi:tetratricopeptide (TPR) repeat protein
MKIKLLLMIFLIMTAGLSHAITWDEYVDIANACADTNYLGEGCDKVRDYSEELLKKKEMQDPAYRFEIYNHYAGTFNFRGDYDKAIKYYKMAVETGYDKDGETYNRLGAALNQAGKYEDALEVYDTAIRLNPQSGMFAANRADTYRKLDMLDDAAEGFEKAISLGHESSALYTNYGNLWLTRGDRYKAVRYYTKALDINPNEVVALYNRAYLYRELWEPLKAVEDFKKLIELEPENGNTYISKIKGILILLSNLEQEQADKLASDLLSYAHENNNTELAEYLMNNFKLNRLPIKIK